jgi:NAD(P)-dependent dehydrogenase (short-subunit alcohol dehydrogenase family)
MRALVTGAAGGLGACIVKALRQYCNIIYEWDIKNGVDVADWAGVHMAAEHIDQLDILVNCAGINHIEWIDDLQPEHFSRVMNVNAMGILNTTQALLHQLHGGTIVNILSNAAHMPMTASLAYCASKAAATQMTRQMAHELGHSHGITVFGVSPNKLANTGMSAYTAQRVQMVRGWTQSEVHANQLAALPAHEETPPELVAEFIAFLLSNKDRHKYLHGCIMTYGGP